MRNTKEKNEFLIVAKTLYGLEDILALEILSIGGSRVEKKNRAVNFWGNKALLYKANLSLRTALRILKPITTFFAKNEKELYKNVKKIPWEDYISLKDTFLIDTTISQSKFFNHSKYVSQKTKDAIVDQFREKCGQRPSVNKHSPKIRINVHVNESGFTISMDSSGESLHKRGYRVQKGKAPINEVLAAGVIMLSGWDGRSPLKDPMCGSGTILIESAMIAKNQAPNLKRKNFSFTFWRDFDDQLLESIKKELFSAEKQNTQKIEGGDYHFAAISASRRNLQNLNLLDQVDLKRFNFFHQKTPHEKRHIIFNPPYGERIEILDPDFYKKMGTTLKSFYKNSDVWVITSDLEKIKEIGLKPSKKIKLFNGSLECQLLKYELYAGSKRGG